MKRLIIAILIFIVATALGLVIARNSTPVELHIGPWLVQAPLGVLIVISLVAFFVLYMVVRCTGILWRLPRTYRKYRAQRRQIKLRSETQRGLLALQAGQFKEAERTLAKTLWAGKEVAANFLLCARAAHEQKEMDHRDRYLQRARALGPQHAQDADIAYAELLLQARDDQKARLLLEKLHQQKPKHSYILKLLAKAYAHLGDWPQLMLLIPKLRKAHILDHDHGLELEKQVYQSLIEHTTQTNPIQLVAIWNKLPRFMQQDTPAIDLYCRGLVQQGQQAVVEKLLRYHLNKKWDPRLAELYGEIDANLSHQLVCAERWLKIRGENDAALLLCLARLCKRSQLWGKARIYFEQRIQLLPSREVYAELAEVHEHLGETAAALACYKKGIKYIDAPPKSSLLLQELA